MPGRASQGENPSAGRSGQAGPRKMTMTALSETIQSLLPVGPRAKTRAFLVGLGILALVVVPLVQPPVYTGVLTRILILGLFAMSLDILLGYTGLPSLGHSTFFGVSGYTVALLALSGVENFLLLLSAGVAAAGFTAALLGLLALRTRGDYFLMITLALNQVLWGIAYKWREVTGGVNGLVGIPQPKLWLPWAVSDELNFYYLVLLTFLVAAVCLFVLVNSPLGLIFRGIREGESRIEALGYSVWWCKYFSFIISGVFGGLAGMLFVFYNAYVSPTDLGLFLSAKVLLMVLLGGAGTLYGPLAGAGIIVVLEDEISSLSERWYLILGCIYVLVAVFAPNGLAGLVNQRRKKGQDQ